MYKLGDKLETAAIFLSDEILLCKIASMARIAWAVAVDYSHPRSNYRQTVFESDKDYLQYNKP